MGMFVNGVGRPPNEVIKRRKIFYFVATILCLCLVGLGTYGINSFLIHTIESEGLSAQANNNVIIVVGASQVVRMKNNVTSYIRGSNTYKQGTNLFFVADGGTGFQYQTPGGKGWNTTKVTVGSDKNVAGVLGIVKKLGKTKKYHIFFPMPGNGIAQYGCDTTSNLNQMTTAAKAQAKTYNDAIQVLKNSNYNVKGYVVSVQPVLPKSATGTDDKGIEFKKYVLYNSNANYCTKSLKFGSVTRNVRSNYKYYMYNSRMMNTVNSSYKTNLMYLPLFRQIVNVGNGSRSVWTYNRINGVNYNTIYDGIHLEPTTTKAYTKFMFDKAGTL